jgi:hypothetical protein
VTCPVFIEARRKLIRNILDRAEEYKDTWWKIMMVQYIWGWDLEPSIHWETVKYPRINFEKVTPSLLDNSQWYYRARIIRELNRFKDYEIEVVWVNTTACVMQSAISLNDNWFSSFVNPKWTLNSLCRETYKKNDFTSRNTINHIKIRYSEQDAIYMDNSKNRIKRDMSNLLRLPEWNAEPVYLWDL